MKNADNTLFSEFKKLLYNIPGSPERDQIAILLNEAVRFEINRDLTKSITKTLDEQPYTIEHNLDFLEVPFPSTWIEWSPHDRNSDGYVVEEDKEYPDIVGTLLAKNPTNENGVIAIIAWKTQRKVDHSQAVLSWNNLALSEMSDHARRSFSKTKTEVFARIMALMNTSVPSGFLTEMNALYDPDINQHKSLEDFYDEAHANASAEALFIISFLLMLQTNQTKIIKHEEEDNGYYYECLLEDKLPKKLLFTPKGFHRKNSMRGTKLEWYPS